jgi:hypothetical protein
MYPDSPARHIAKRRAKGEFFGSDGLELETDGVAMSLRSRLRRFTRVELESDHRVVAFRYFDPAILREFLLNCDNDEFDKFLGPVRFFLAEDYTDHDLLNKPHQLIIFSRTFEKSGTGAARAKPMAQFLNVNDNAVTAANISDKNESIRKTTKSTPLFLIRKEILDHLHLFEKVISVENMIDSVYSVYIEKCKKSYLNKIVLEEFERASKIDLDQEDEIYALVLCRLVIGDKYLENSDVDRVIRNSNRSSVPHDLIKICSNYDEKGVIR